LAPQVLGEISPLELEAVPFLNLRGVTKHYQTRSGTVSAIQDVNFDVGQGEFVSLLGPSGSGKSTVLKMVSGLLPPSDGEILLQGRPVTGPYPDVGIVFQSPLLLRWRSVLRNVMLPAEVLGLPRNQVLEKARKLLSVVGLAGFEQKMPHELSGGMQQRVALCRALIHDPAILLMDEPFGALDELTREEMGDYLQSLWEVTGKTVLFVTHSVSEAVYLSSRVVVLSPRPAVVRDVVEIDLPRPRTPEIRFHPRFAHLMQRIRRALGLPS
jgi:NitT/TauT family transport system ATP-binding protein